MVLCSSLLGQTRPAGDSLATVSIVTEPSGADVYIDSTFVGKSPLESIPVSSGSHSIKAFYPSVLAWNAVVRRDSLEVLGGEKLQKKLTMGNVLTVQSDPSGGIVTYRRSVLGSTPLYLHFSSPAAGSLLIRKPGFDSLRVPLGEVNGGLIRVQLQAMSGSNGGIHAGDVFQGDGRLASDHLLAYVSGATMLVSGITSAYLKDRANHKFDLYQQTYNPADLSSTRRFDHGAAATLIVSEISFAILAYLLLSE